MQSCCVAGIPLVYINNFIQIWCDAPFYGMLCGSNSRRMYFKLHGPPFESSGGKYIWIILLCSNTNDSCSGFHLQPPAAPPRHAAWSERISMVCQMAVYGAPSQETAIVWNQPNSGRFTLWHSILPLSQSFIGNFEIPYAETGSTVGISLGSL